MPTLEKRGRRIYWRTVLILAVMLAIVTSVGFRLMYTRSLDATFLQLTELAQAQARIMESVAKFDAYYQSGGVEGAARSATLSQFKEGHRAFRGFAESGEIMLGERVGDEVVFLLPARKLGYEIPHPTQFSEDRSGPMVAALNGHSGTVIAPDYSGEQVLAAYEWMPFLEMGLVTKVDLAEIRAPFYRAAAVTIGLALLAILVGAALNNRAVSPLISQIVENAETIRQREATYRQLVDTLPGIVYEADLDDRLTMREMGLATHQVTGYSAAELIGNARVAFADIIYPEDRPHALDIRDDSFDLDYRIVRPDGEIRWLGDHGSIAENAEGLRVRKGVLLDVTARKLAEQKLEALPRKLSRYISPQVYRSIFEGDQDALVGSTRKKLTVFFSDVVNFTVKSEALDPDDLTFIVNSYLNRMAEVAVRHGGTLDKFIGDGVVIFFGDPESQGVKQDALACVNMAMDMQKEIDELNEAALANGIRSPIEVRMGIATGYCTVGNFGSESRMDYTVLGKTANLAARIEAAGAAGSILVSDDTAILIDQQFTMEEAEPILAKGFKDPVPVKRITGRV